MKVGSTTLAFAGPEVLVSNLKANLANLRTLYLVGLGTLEQIAKDEIYARIKSSGRMRWGCSGCVAEGINMRRGCVRRGRF